MSRGRESLGLFLALVTLKPGYRETGIFGWFHPNCSLRSDIKSLVTIGKEVGSISAALW